MTDKEFLTLAFLMYGRDIPYDANETLENAYAIPSVSSLEHMESERLVNYTHYMDGWFQITDKGMALIGEDNEREN